MLSYLKEACSMTRTENGAAAYKTTFSHCLDLFSAIGAARGKTEEEILSLFTKAWYENKDTAMKILFYGRDIRGGLGERRVFRIILRWLAQNDPDAVRKNITLIPEYGRYDDLISLLHTPCGTDTAALIKAQLDKDLHTQDSVSLLAKWLPSVNTSHPQAVKDGKYLARLLKMNEAEYRKTLSLLRQKIRILENNLRESDYTFDYEKQPSKAMLKYRKAFLRNDGERYKSYLSDVQSGKAGMHTAALYPYDIIRPCLVYPGFGKYMSAEERNSVNTTWNELESFSSSENALAVVDGSGSMYSGGCGGVTPIAVALSLGLYFAEHNTGEFANHFITFSETPQLIEIKGKDITDKVGYCASFNEVANTNIQAVFELILQTAVRHAVPQKEMVRKIFIISDMEFDYCTRDADITCFAYAKQLFAEHGYVLPQIVFWNVNSRSCSWPVTRDETGTVLISGCTPRLFSMATDGSITPEKLMMEIIGSERYAPVSA